MNTFSTPTVPFDAEEYLTRIKKLILSLAKEKIDAALIQTNINQIYLTGFDSSNAILLVRPGHKPVFYTDFRYLEAAKKQITFASVERLDKLPQLFGPMAAKAKWQTVAYEGGISISQYNNLTSSMPNVKKWQDCSSLIMDLRMIKSKNEERVMRQAIKMNDLVFAKTIQNVRPGMTEYDIRRELRFWGNQYGQDQAFAIVCIGSNASNCHHIPGNRILRHNQELLIDTGTQVQGYLSDMTRTVFFGKPSNKLKEIYDIVLKANMEAIEHIAPGKTCKDIDTIARNIIVKHGYGKYFGHGLGHGVGLAIHESPFFSQNDHTKLKSGMFLTVEPGIYLPGIGGVRIEDMVRVKRGGCDLITATPKELTSY